MAQQANDLSGLSRIMRGKVKAPPRVVLYGTEGIGKSTFAAGAPEPIFIPTEDGLNEIDCAKFPLARSMDDVMDYLRDLYTEPHEFRTLVIDTVDWLEKLIFQQVCAEGGKNSIEEFSFGSGPKLALSKWKEVLTALDMIREEKGMAIILLAHSKVETVKDPESQGYDRHTLRLHKDADAYVREWSDAILFAQRKILVEKVGTGTKERGIAKPVGQDGGMRVMRTNGSAAYVAKNRYGITGDLPLDWNAFAERLN